MSSGGGSSSVGPWDLKFYMSFHGMVGAEKHVDKLVPI